MPADVAAWDAARLIGATAAADKQAPERYAAVVLNQPIHAEHKDLVGRIWERATLRLCADGGANRMFDCYGTACAPPHEIRGDLDSLRPDVKMFFGEKRVPTVKAASNYATDLQKCIRRVEQVEEEHGEERGGQQDQAASNSELALVILGGLSGRLDQTMHTIHVLCQLAKESAAEEDLMKQSTADTSSQGTMGIGEDDLVTLRRRNKALVISENSVAWILSKGKHTMHVDHRVFGPTCGLLPFAAQVGEAPSPAATRIWTSGLEWNLNGEECAVGGFLSTSNHLKDSTVTVETEREIMWTMEIREDVR